LIISNIDNCSIQAAEIIARSCHRYINFSSP
jgi:hypothetical protein